MTLHAPGCRHATIEVNIADWAEFAKLSRLEERSASAFIRILVRRELARGRAEGVLVPLNSAAGKKSRSV